MTNEEALRYWEWHLERAEEWSDLYWEASERKVHKEYVDAMKMAIEALKAKTDGDTISRQAAIDVAKDVHNAVLCCEVSPSKSLLEVVKRLESLPTAEPKREECEEREQGLCPFYAE